MLAVGQANMAGQKAAFHLIWRALELQIMYGGIYTILLKL